MQHLLLVDETFDLNSTQEYYLSIQFSLDGFSFCIRDSLQNKYIYLFHKDLAGNPQFLIKKLNSIYAEFPILEADFKATSLCFSSPAKTTLVPLEFFSEEEATSNFRLGMDLAEKEELLHLPLKKHKLVTQVAIPGNLRKWILEKHPGSMIQNDLTSFLDDFTDRSHPTSLVIHIYKNHVNICVLNEKLQFFNTFYYSNDNDLLYYILNVSQSLDDEDVAVVLNGRVNKRSVIYHRLRQYFKEVSIESRNENAYYSYLFDQLPDARFVNLLNRFS